ncbi:MAG: 3-oxoacyl-ACP synthase III [Desulfobacterales bacterium]|nr:3-oxoacyl-ACP synthase III [Desulfobacterales bacterium]
MESKAHIEAMASHHAPRIISSDWIEDQFIETMDRIGFPQHNLERLTGIKERRFWEKGTRLYEMSTIVCRRVIEEAGVDPQEIGVLINTSVCRDYLEPSQASLIHGSLGLSQNCLNFDITNACLGFVNGLDIVRSMIEQGKIKYGIVVTTEGSPEALDHTIELIKRPDCTAETFMNNFATLTIGCGSVAMLLSREDVASNGHRINDSAWLSDTSNGNNMLCVAKCDYSGMETNAAALLENGMPLAVKTWQKANRYIANWHDEKIDLYVPHQTSSRQINAFANNCGITRAKIHLVLQTLGNVVSAAVPLALLDAHEQKRIKPDDHVGLIGIGSGLNCMMMSVTW